MEIKQPLFQSTRPHGARRNGDMLVDLTLAISIHAPTRGATVKPGETYDIAVFQSTRPHGARRQQQYLRPCGSRFQSTRPHGARRNLCTQHVISCDFNPRAHTGRDFMTLMTRVHKRNFNPRAHTGRDLLKRWQRGSAALFQSTRPHGARHVGIVKELIRHGFQSTRPHGARRFCASSSSESH